MFLTHGLIEPGPPLFHNKERKRLFYPAALRVPLKESI